MRMTTLSVSLAGLALLIGPAGCASLPTPGPAPTDAAGDDDDDDDAGDDDDDDAVDADGDGAPADEDCDDDDPYAFPGAPELCDGARNDCDGRWTSDAGTATWFADDGEPTPMTDVLADGTRQRAAEVSLDQAGTLVLCEGTWFAELALDADITVRGVDGAVLSGDGDGSVLSVGRSGAVVVVEDLVVTGGAGAYGGGLDTPATAAVDVTLRRTMLRDNVADGVDAGYGGGAYVLGTLTLEDATVIDNIAAVGGGLAVIGELVADGALIEGNRAEIAGGLLVLNGELELLDVQLVGNQGGSGGQLYLEAATGAGENVTVADGTADFGAGVLLVDARLTLTDSAIRDNAAAMAGGGVYAMSGSELELVDTVIDGNAAVRYSGGAIDTSAGAGGGAYLLDSVLACSGAGGLTSNEGVWGPGVFADFATGGGGEIVSDGCDWTSSETSLSSAVPTDELHVLQDQYTEHLARFGTNARFSCDAAGCR